MNFKQRLLRGEPAFGTMITAFDTPELVRMGANIRTEGKVAVVEGVRRLWGARVCARDLRGGAALAIAGAAACGRTIIENAGFIDRGYEALEKSLAAVGVRAGRCGT